MIRTHNMRMFYKIIFPNEWEKGYLKKIAIQREYKLYT